MEWIEMSQDRNRWRALVNAVMNPEFRHSMFHPTLIVTYSSATEHHNTDYHDMNHLN